MIFIFSSLAPNSTLFILLDFVSFIIGHWLTIACVYTRDSSEDDDEKTKIHNFVQLSFTKIIKHLRSTILPQITSSHRNLSHHIATLIISLFSSSTPSSSHDCIGGIFLIRNKDLSYPLSPWRVASLRKNGSTHHQATQQRHDEQREMATWIIDWVGENPRQNENIALEPRFFLLYFFAGVSTVSGRESYVCTRCSRNRASGRAHTHTHKRDHEYLHDITMTTPLRFSTWARVRAWLGELVCVWASEPLNRVSTSECDEKFSISKWRPKFFSQLVCLGSLVMGKRFTNDERRLGWFGFPSTLIARLNSTSTEIESLFPNQKKKEI